jgi:hypothetical protein
MNLGESFGSTGTRTEYLLVRKTRREWMGHDGLLGLGLWFIDSVDHEPENSLRIAGTSKNSVKMQKTCNKKRLKKLHFPNALLNLANLGRVFLGIQQGPIDFGMSRPHLVGRVFTSVKTLPGWYPKIAGNPWYRMLISPNMRIPLITSPILTHPYQIHELHCLVVCFFMNSLES